MKRKTFLTSTAPFAVLPFLRDCFRLPFFQSTFGTSEYPAHDRILVLVQLEGGNDGLNTVIPLDQYTQLSSARKNILIPDSYVLPLKDSSVTGLHPSMKHLQSLYNNQQLAIIQGVGYPNTNMSHFRSTDIWLTGSDSKTILNNGWIGRYLAQEYPHYPQGYPNKTQPAPPAIQIGSVLSTALLGPSVGLGTAITSTQSFYDLTIGAYETAPHTPAGEQLSFMRMVASETRQYTAVLKSAAGAQKNLSKLYPNEGNGLANQLKIVAQLIGGGLQTKVYMLSIGGFDTHGGQVDFSNPIHGQHSELLSQLSTAIAAFQDDLTLMGVQDKVLGMTFSEFGRRIKSNASHGTDHGSSGPVFLFGSKVKGGMYGTNPVIPAKVGVNDNLALQYDFRSVYASVLKGWFGVTDSELAKTLPGMVPSLNFF
jgi:uncharacterized protein (DUF1501 family)